MAPSFNVDIATRDKILFDGRATSLVAPAKLGYLGILADHAPFMTTLGPGKITLRKESGENMLFRSTGNGFLNVLKNHVTILLDSGEQSIK